jgi:hypothetical protein
VKECGGYPALLSFTGRLGFDRDALSERNVTSIGVRTAKRFPSVQALVLKCQLHGLHHSR